MAQKMFTQQISSLSREMLLLRSAVISFIGEKDPEGQYRPEYVKRVLRLASHTQRGIPFTTTDDLLKRMSGR